MVVCMVPSIDSLRAAPTVYFSLSSFLLKEAKERSWRRKMKEKGNIQRKEILSLLFCVFCFFIYFRYPRGFLSLSLFQGDQKNELQQVHSITREHRLLLIQGVILILLESLKSTSNEFLVSVEKFCSGAL